MKTVHLIRHAKSSWDYPGLPDVDRPLNSRGKTACGIMAPHILEAGCNFETVFCSIAKRAQWTIEGISAALPEVNFTWSLESNLYTFSSQDLLSFCQNLDEGLEEVVLVGHNPAMTGFTNAMGNQYLYNLPTCGYVQIEFPTSSWERLSPETGTTKVILAPKMFR